MLLLALGSPRVCVRRDRKHAQGKVLKARACWFSNLHLPQARAGSTYCAILALASGSGLGHPATHLRSHQRCARCTRCWVAALCVRGSRVESSSQTRILLALGSPRVCVRRDSKHAQGKVLKACPGWVLQQGLAASARWLDTASCSCRVQALATLPHTSAPFSTVQFLHLLLGCRH